MPEHHNFDERLAQRLRAYESRVPDEPAPPTVTLRSRPPMGAIAAIAAAAALAGIVMAGTVLNRQDLGTADPSQMASPSVSATPLDSPSASAEPSPTDSPSDSPAPSSGASPTPISTPAPAAAISGVAWADRVAATVDGHVFRITAERGRFYALGSVGQTATVWSSDDGAAWEAAALPFPSSWGGGQVGFLYVDELAAIGDRLVAIGTIGINDYLEVVAWESTDGSTWSEIQTGDLRVDAFSIGDISNGPVGLVAISHHYGPGTGSAWYSADGGRTWTEHRPPGDAVTATAVVGTNRGYLIAGGAGESYDNVMTSSPRIWYSNDATTWTPASVEGSGGHGLVEQLAIDGSGRWAAVGALEGRIVVWRSTDRGLSWTITADLGAVSGSTRADFRMVGAPDGFIAISGTDPAVTWTSVDGVAWQQGAPDRPTGIPDGRQIGWHRGTARIGDVLVVAGVAVAPNGPSDDRWFSWVGTIQR